MSDELFSSARLPDPGIRALYRLENRWQAWLDVEAALARAQDELGLIPAGAGEAIARSAKLDLLDRGRIDEALKRASHPLMPLIWELARVTGDPSGGWVHWGATTQNIIQTGDLVVLRQAHRVFDAILRRTMLSAASLADKTAEMVMAGRTHGQHAVPITFGFKVAVWIDELLRHRERLAQIEPRVFVAMMGGAAGTYASMGDTGPAVQAKVGEFLGMGSMLVPARTTLDHLAEYVLILGLLAASCAKIGREVYDLMKTEVGEAEEPVPVGTVGSSTMPQKRNPQLCQDIIASAAEIRSIVPLVLEAVQVEHEADRTSTVMLRDATSRACILTGDMLVRLELLLSEMQVYPNRMRANLDLGHGLIMAEAVMLQLGRRIGRQVAHDVVYDASQAAFAQGRPFRELLLADERITREIADEDILALLDPAAYVGMAPQIAREAAARARLQT
jgi:adenylosuccinate lyase